MFEQNLMNFNDSLTKFKEKYDFWANFNNNNDLRTKFDEQLSLLQTTTALGTGQQAQQFESVKNMVNNMITQLRAASVDEDRHRSWCEAEV